MNIPINSKSEIDIIDRVKIIRAKIYSLIYNMFYLSSKENKIAKDSLLKARMHLGNYLAEMSPGTNPYPLSDNVLSSVIEPTADIEQYTYEQFPSEFTEVQKIKGVRFYIKELIEELKEYNQYDPRATYWTETFKTQAVIDLVLARNYFGLELGRIKEQGCAIAPPERNNTALWPEDNRISYPGKF